MTDTSTLRDQILGLMRGDPMWDAAISSALAILDAHTAEQPAPTRKGVMPSEQTNHSADPQHETSPGVTAGAIQPAPDAVAEAAKPSLCDGCGQPTTSTCWADCGMSLCGFPLCGNCQHVDERFGWSHKPATKGHRP